MVQALSVKTPEEIRVLAEGGALLSAVLHDLTTRARPGVSTFDLDTHAEQSIRNAGGTPLFKGYRVRKTSVPFPASICTSINDEVVHGIPRKDRRLKDGDIISIDIGMRYKNLVTDTAVTVGVGAIAPDAERLIRVTKESLDIGIAVVRPGATLGDIGSAIGTQLKKAGLGVIRDLAGHGVGYELHEPPLIPNYGTPGAGIALKEGMVIAIEPMATLGDWRVTLDDDEWTFRTADHSLAAHFEHTVAVTRDGAEILTMEGTIAKLSQ